jgi:Spy/CpxP family protein refolding chaperone
MKLFARLLILGPLGLSATAAESAAAAAAAEEPASPVISETGCMTPAVETESKAPTTEAETEAPAVEMETKAPAIEAETKAPAAEVEPTGKGTEVAEPRNEQIGFVQIIGDALSEVSIDEEQRKTIESLGRVVTSYDQAVMDARRDLLLALADQIEAGKMDRNELADEVDALVAARKEANPVLFGALHILHGILDEGQREAFANALEARMDEKKELHESHEAFGAWASEIGLDEEQKDVIRAAMEEAAPLFSAERETMMELVDAFRGENFSPEYIVPLEETSHRVRERAEAMFKIAEVLANNHTPEQRTAAKEKLHGRLD